MLAIRAFNRFLLDECADLARRGLDSESAWVRWRNKGSKDRDVSTTHEAAVGDEATLAWQGQPFELREDVKVDMYISDAPCGDASMELVMAEQEDVTPWEKQEEMPGRGNFDRLGVVRRKPARPDAPLTLSKSCSDKLAVKQCTSLLNSVTSLLVHPGRCYIRRLVLPGDRCVPSAVQRAFGREGRMALVADAAEQESWWQSGYRFSPFEVATTSKRFEYEKTEGSVASNISSLCTPHRQETLINGVLQGRKQFDPKGASCVSRRGLCEAAKEVADAAGDILDSFGMVTYDELKNCSRLNARSTVKQDVRREALQTWKANKGDEDWDMAQ